MIAQLLGLCLFLLALAAPAAATSVVIRTYDRKDFKGSLALSVEGGEPCRSQWTGKDQYRDICTLELPRDAGALSLQGDFAWVHYNRGKQKAKGQQRWQIVDIGPLMSGLRDTKKPFGQRLHDFVAAKAEFERKHKALVEAAGPLPLELKAPASPAAVKEGEKRLGFRLPPEYESLLLKAGGMSLDDSSTTDADQLMNAYDFMVKVWETPPKHLAASVSPRTATLLKTSAPLFTEVGDGLGALLYHPEKTAACGGQPAYYWIHQDTIDEPVLLKNRDGKCKDFTEAMMWVVATLGLDQYDGSGLDLVLVDRSAPGPWKLELLHEDGFHFRLSVPWEEYE
jgi:hypothetical protein